MRISTKVTHIVLFCLIFALSFGGERTTGVQSSGNAPTMISAPVVGDEIEISALDNVQSLPAVAYNSLHDEYLVVWTNQWPGNYDIYAKRVSGSGELLSWFAVAPHTTQHPYPNDRLAPAVAYDSVNDRYLIVWLYDTLGNASNWDVHGIFVNWDGPIPGLPHFTICDWPTIQDFPDVAYSPATEEFMIVWMSQGAVPAYISGRRMRASDGGFISTGSDFTINHVSEARVRPKIAYNSWHSEYLVVYDNTHDVFATRITTAGVKAGPEFGIAAWPGDEIYPSVAYCDYGDQYLVAWENDQPDIFARFVNADGSLTPIVLHLDYTSIYEMNPRVACNAENNRFLVVWQQQYSNTTGPFGVWGQYVSPYETLGASFGIKAPTGGVPAHFTTPVVAGGEHNFLVVWEHDRAYTSYQDIHGSLITPFSIYTPVLFRNK